MGISDCARSTHAELACDLREAMKRQGVGHDAVASETEGNAASAPISSGGDGLVHQRLLACLGLNPSNASQKDKQPELAFEAIQHNGVTLGEIPGTSWTPTETTTPLS